MSRNNYSHSVNERSPRLGGARRIGLVYGVFALLWILLSSGFLSFNVDDPVLQARVELPKGIVFVLVTTELLYLLLRNRRQWGNSAAVDVPGSAVRHRKNWLLLVAMLAPATPR